MSRVSDEVVVSEVAEMLAGRIEALDAPGDPTLAFLASGMEGIKVPVARIARPGR